jgi:hypothetical protein
MSRREGAGQQSMSFAEASRVRTSPAPESGEASVGNAPVSGTTSPESSGRSGRVSSSSRTSRRGPERGCLRSGTDCTCSVTERAPWGLAPQSVALLICESASLLLPTLTAKGNLLSPSMLKWRAHRNLIPTLTARHAKGPGTLREGGRDLPQVSGGHLSPTFCEWLMGFPEGYTEVTLISKDAGAKACPACRSGDSMLSVRGDRRKARETSSRLPKTDGRPDLLHEVSRGGGAGDWPTPDTTNEDVYGLRANIHKIQPLHCEDVWDGVLSEGGSDERKEAMGRSGRRSAGQGELDAGLRSIDARHCDDPWHRPVESEGRDWSVVSPRARIKALGNAVVPQCAAVAGKVVQQIARRRGAR